MNNAMSVNPHTLDMMERDHMVQYLRDEAGFNMPSHTKDDTLKQKIKDYWRSEGLFQHEDAPAMRTPKSIGSNAHRAWHRIMIPFGGEQDQGARRPVAVTVNGETLTIPRNQEVDVPVAWIEALRNAIKVTIDPVSGEQYSTPRYGFTIIQRDIKADERIRSVTHKPAIAVSAPSPLPM